MSKITRPDADVVAFGSQAQSGERTVFGNDSLVSDDLTDNLNADYIRGWFAGLDPVNGFPPVEYFNGQIFTTSQLVSYLFQMGISEWNANQFYPIHARAMSGVGVMWKSLQNHTGQPQIEGIYWTNDDSTNRALATSATLTSGQDWNGIAYADPDAIGANPEAAIYPDGTIVGSTDNGIYVKYPNGDLTCLGRKSAGTTSNSIGSLYRSDGVSFTFPVNLVEAPTTAISAQKTGGTSAEFVFAGELAPASTESIHIVMFSNGPSATGNTSYIAIGRWK